MTTSGKERWPSGIGSFYWVVAALALLGLGLASYLTYLDFTTAHVLFCTVDTGCDRVRASQYSTLLGVPVALFGALLYVAVIAVALAPLADMWKRASLFGMATLGFVFSAYLTYAELFWIHAICPYCVASAIVMTAIFVAALLRRPAAPTWPVPRLALLGVAVAAFTVVGATFVPRQLPASPAAAPAAPFASTTAAIPAPEATTPTPSPTPVEESQILAEISGQCPSCSSPSTPWGFGVTPSPLPTSTPTPSPTPVEESQIVIGNWGQCSSCDSLPTPLGYGVTPSPLPTPTPTPSPTATPTPTPTPFPWAGLSQKEFQEGLAKHLRDIKTLLYFSPTCPHCADQKALFGDAVKYLNQVNCSGAEYSVCVSRGISAVPTWEIRGKLYLGVRSLEELAILSGYKP